ncbi:MAG: biotin-dependent carboxyltransferase family protein [Candidatus Fimivivens sp.]
MGMTILNGGFLTTVQDAGRVGYQQYGVPVSGVMDPRSFAIANMLVGNEKDEAVLEITMLGPTATFDAANVIAITGGNLSPALNGAPMPMYRAVAVNPGDKLTFGMQVSGCRAYLAVAGGVDIAPVMGSRSTYLKAQIGGVSGRKLDKQDHLAFRSPKTDLPNLSQGRFVAPEDFSPTHKTLRVVMGPQDDAFTEKGIATFLDTSYAVTNQFDRMGCRLEGTIIEHIKGGDIISDGISMGAVQIPSAGQPIIMLADRQTTGGYTKIANVITADFPLIAQCKFGDTVHFKAVTVTEAQDIYLSNLRRLEAMRTDLDLVQATPGPWEFTVNIEGTDYRCRVKPR